MRIKKILLILILIFIFVPNIKADDNVFTCVYEKENEKITVKMNSTYKFDVSANFTIKEKNDKDRKKKNLEPLEDAQWLYYSFEEIQNNLQYNNFLDKNSNFFCPTEIYLNEYNKNSSGRSGSHTTFTYTVSREKQEADSITTIENQGSSSQTWEKSQTYTLNTQESSVSIKTPSSAKEDSGWLKVCNYGNIIFAFNKSKYEFLDTGDYDNLIFDMYTSSEPLLKKIKDNLYACPVTLCIRTVSGRGYYANIAGFSFDNSELNNKNCIIGAEYSNEKYKCVGVVNNYNEFIDYHNKYVSKKNTKYLKLRNESKEKLISFCNSALSTLNYDGVDYCVKDCLEVEEELKNTLNISTNGECGFSARLMVWISNILRWIKYILPVIVIVMGILDFIKAIAADKDDEMKKAQGRFVKRLIAAALVFIIPLILEFVLDKMGFGYNDCGLF